MSTTTHALVCFLLMRLQHGSTLLSAAANKNSVKTMEMLVEAGAELSAADKVGVIFSACVHARAAMNLTADM